MELKKHDENAFAFMMSQFPDSAISGNRYLASCPECGKVRKFWWSREMPHNGGCFACGYEIKSVFDLGYRTERKTREIFDLSDINNLRAKYHNTSGKKHRLSDKIVKEFGLKTVSIKKRDNSGAYYNIAYPFENKLGYIKHLNFSGRWVSIPGAERSEEKWLNTERIRHDTETVFVLAGEWDLFSFFENTGIHGISPIDGEGTPGKFKREYLSIFANKHVVIIFDNDNTGYAGGRNLARRIQKFHKTKSIKVIDLSRLGLEGGGDIDDYFSSGGDMKRLFLEIELTPEYSTMLNESDVEAARVLNGCARPENPNSILEPEILDKIWAAILLPKAKREDLFGKLADENGADRNINLNLHRAEVRKYNQELETLRFLAYDILVSKHVEKLHVKQTKKLNSFESENFYYYGNGYYSPLDNSLYTRVSDDIARLVTAPDDRKELSKTRKQALEDFKIRILDSEAVDFEEKNDFINFENGIYDLKSRELKAHGPEYLVTNKLPIEYDRNADCPEFKNALKVWIENEEDQNELLKGLYYLISGDRSVETVFWFHGTGEDGKTQVTMLCEALVGPEKRSAVAVEKIDDRHASILLYGKLLNIADEVPKNFKISDAMFKRMSGNSLMTGDPKYRDQITFKSRALWIIPSNHFPNSSDTSHGYHRRFKIFKFRRVPKEVKIEDYFNVKLRNELPGIINLLLTKGRELYEKEGFKKTEAENKSMEEMKSKNTVFAYWQNVTAANEHEIETLTNKFTLDLAIKYETLVEAEEAAKIKAVDECEPLSENIDFIYNHTILQRYNHRVRGEIYIINTDKHYKFYKEFFEGDEVHLVSRATFRTGSLHFAQEYFRDRFQDAELIQVWKQGESGDGKTNCQIICMKK